MAKGRRYDVKVLSADGLQHSKTFATKRAAVEYEARQTAALADGLFIPPRAGATTVAALAERWLSAGAKRESTRDRDRSIVANHVLPGLGATRPLAKVSRADCQVLVDQWQAAGLVPRTVARHADLIVRNPAARLKIPAAEQMERPNVTGAELERLAETLGGDHEAFMWCGAILGCVGQRRPG